MNRLPPNPRFHRGSKPHRILFSRNQIIFNLKVRLASWLFALALTGVAGIVDIIILHK